MLRARKTNYGYEIEAGKTFGLQKSIWDDKRYNANENGSSLVNELISGSGFTYPKSLWTVFDTLAAVCKEDKESIIVDFYAGSGTTAHACLEMNARDGGSRRAILVQAPVRIEEENRTGAVSFDTIVQLSRERIRRAGAKILAENPGLKGKLDVGFRAFRIDSGNFHDVKVSPAEASQGTLEGLVSPIKDDRSEEDLLFGALLRWGVDITLPVRRGELLSRTVWLVDPPGEADGPGAAVVACFDRPGGAKGGVDVALAEALAALKPLRVLLRDDGFACDADKENVASRLRQRAPDTELKVL